MLNKLTVLAFAAFVFSLATPAQAQTSSPVRYTVKLNDSLSLIAQRECGNPQLYVALFNANKDVIRTPRLIYPGQVITISCGDDNSRVNEVPQAAVIMPAIYRPAPARVTSPADRHAAVKEAIYFRWQEYGADKAIEMIATIGAESRFDPNAMNWNCRYGIGPWRKSKPCNYNPARGINDRHKAWSVDCGVAQISVKGQVCPPALFDPEYNLDVAVKMYAKRGFSPWMAYGNKHYRDNLARYRNYQPRGAPTYVAANHAAFPVADSVVILRSAQRASYTNPAEGFKNTAVRVR